LGLGGVVFDSVWGVIPPERNTARNKGRKCFHCLGAPNNLIRPWFDICTSQVVLQGGTGDHLRQNKISEPVKFHSHENLKLL